MINRSLKSEAGYSLIEVMVSILILTAAILPMVGMFDTGLRAASSGGNYDTARAFANKKLEQTKSLPYNSAAPTAQDVRDNFPVAGAAMPPSGEYNSPSPITNATQVDVPPGFSYSVRKRFVWSVPNAAGTEMTITGPQTSDTPPAPPAPGSTSLGGMIEVRVTVNWGNGNSYSTTSIVADG